MESHLESLSCRERTLGGVFGIRVGWWVLRLIELVGVIVLRVLLTGAGLEHVFSVIERTVFLSATFMIS